MIKRIFIISCLVALIFALCGVNTFADEHQHNWAGDFFEYSYCIDCGYSCYHEFGSVEYWFDDKEDSCRTEEYSCPDCGYYEIVTTPHTYVDGICRQCKKCEHNWDYGYCNNCNTWCEHNFTNGVCNVCAYKCLHSVGFTDSVCNECGITCTHIFDDGICGICGIECGHNWIEYDRKHTHNRNLDCYTSFERCEYCDEEWSNGFGHNINDYNVCIECNIYMNCLHEWIEDGECIDCGWKCEHIYDGWGICHTCGERCQHSNRLTHEGENSFPSANGFCWFSYEKCIDCNYEIEHYFYSHTFDNGKCVDCGISLEGVTCKHNSLNITDEGFTYNQNSYCYRIIENCVDCRHISYRDISHEFNKGTCVACGLKFVTHLEEQIKEEGYREGFENGYAEGEADGHWYGYDEGYEQGKTDGYEEGKTYGYEEGTSDGYEFGYSDGYNLGVRDGYEGDLDSLTDKYYKEGYDKGYAKGEADTHKYYDENGFGNLFYQLFDAEVKIFQNMLSFEIFGINIAGLIVSIISILIIGFIFKKVI